MNQYPTNKETLHKYYELWRDGHDARDIQERLCLNDAQFNRLTPHFLNYCRHAIKHETRDALAGGGKPDIIPLSCDRRKKFLGYVSSGLSYDKAARMMYVPLVTVLDYWFVENPAFKSEAEYAIELLDADIIMSLVKRAKGFSSDIATETTVDSDTEKGRFKSTTKSRTKRYIAGDVGAQKFWLINRKPDQFSVDGEINRKGNKGKILEAIDELIGTEDDDKLDEKYEEG